MLGEGIGPIFLDQLMCNGSEATLLECLPSENIGLHNCHHNEDAGVRCEGLLIYIPHIIFRYMVQLCCFLLPTAVR